MALEKQLADTDSVYCTKVTNSNQSSIFISNLGDSELDALFGADYKSDDAVRLRLNRRNLAFNAVAHVVDGRTWYKRKSSDKWDINAAWLNDRLSTLADVFASDEGVFIAYLNKDDRSTHRLYMKGMTSLPREDGGKNIALRDFLFSGDVVVLTKLENGDVSFEIKIPDDPVISYIAKNGVDGSPIVSEVRQLITYGAPGTGKSFKTKNETKGETVFRTTFHPDSDYATFVGAYKPTMKDDRVAYTEVSRKESSGAFGVVEKREQKFGICYKFVDQVFTKAYTAAWKYQKAASAGVAPKKVYLIIEEINRGNCAQVFGDLFQLLDRNPQGFSEYGVIPDADFGKHIGEELAKEASVIDPTRKSQINALYPEIESGVDLVDEVLAGRMLLFPDNLYIRATMNTSDQSLFPMDSAFKRRWDWDYVAIKDHPEEEWEIEIDATTHYRWWDFLEVINKEIFKATSSEDKQLGYFFARTPNKKIDLNMFVNKVVFYLWNSVFKDCYTDCEFLKEDKDHYFTFTSFFNKGVIDPERAKKFLGKLKGLQSKEAKAAASRNPAATTGTDAVAATTDAGAENA